MISSPVNKIKIWQYLWNSKIKWMSRRTKIGTEHLMTKWKYQSPKWRGKWGSTMNYRLNFCHNLSWLVPESLTKGKIQEPMYAIEIKLFNTNQSHWFSHNRKSQIWQQSIRSMTLSNQNDDWDQRWSNISQDDQRSSSCLHC